MKVEMSKGEQNATLSLCAWVRGYVCGRRARSKPIGQGKWNRYGLMESRLALWLNTKAGLKYVGLVRSMVLYRLNAWDTLVNNPYHIPPSFQPNTRVLKTKRPLRTFMMINMSQTQ